MASVPVIDIFAGPGGLGEGFSSYEAAGEPVFKIKLSIEKDQSAHRTLELRAFVRQFPRCRPPQAYYDYIRGQIRRDQLLAQYPDESQAARGEAWLATLGKGGTPDAEVDKRIETALGTREKWVLIGGPPCQAYSLAGRSRILGADRKNGTRKYSRDHRHYLYREYLRILADHCPPVFVMENVKGILSSKAKGAGIFKCIVDDLRYPVRAAHGSMSSDVEYRIYSLASGSLSPSDFQEYVVRCEDFGIPQRRHRVILVGVRSDIRNSPAMLQREDPSSVLKAIGDLPRLRSGLSGGDDSSQAWIETVSSVTSMAWLREAPSDIADEIRRVIGALVACKADRGANFVPSTSADQKPLLNPGWFYDPKLQGYCNHETRGHISHDLYRYLYAACFAKIRGVSPKVPDFPKRLYPAHENVKNVKAGDMIFSDRFRVQLRNAPATTVVSHIAKDGHYFIHYDPSQCRSLTVREAARLQTFPDNYFFEGPRTEQYKQVGNAVPPLLARQIAEIVHALLDVEG